MAVSADHRAVKADLGHIIGGDSNQLCGEEILLSDAVHIVKQAHDGKLHAILALVGIGSAAYENIQPLTGNALGHCLLHLVGGEVRQQIGYNEAWLARLTADGDFNGLTALERDNAVQLQRNGDPLVLFDAAVVVRLEVAQFVGLIHGYLLEVEARGIDVRARNHCALGEALLADDGKHERLAAVISVYSHAGPQLHAELILDKALLLGQRNCVLDRLALGTGVVQVAHILPAVILNGDALICVDKVISVLLLVKELASQFIHFTKPPQMSFCIFL